MNNKIKKIFNLIFGLDNCSQCDNPNIKPGSKKIILAGTPNVGKSVLFNRLTNSRATVSNYPGTTVDVCRGISKIQDNEYELIDTPGIYSLFCITEEEKVARKLIMNEDTHLILNVIDAKNLERHLPFTIQLIEAGLSVILVLNIMDEAENLGLKIDIKTLEKKLNIPVIPTTSITGQGINLLKHRINEYLHTEHLKINYGKRINTSIKAVENLLTNTYSIDKKAFALLAIQNDKEIIDTLKKREPTNTDKILRIISYLESEFDEPINFIINMKRTKYAKYISDEVLKKSHKKTGYDIKEFLSKITMNPITGIPILIFVIYFGLYKFVGEFGAGTIVDFLEGHLFNNIINPYITHIVEKIIPWTIFQDLLVHKYGIITLGIRYAVALVLPIVGTFFFVFAIIEDSGYLPRLAMLVDRIFKKIGLSGRAIIPMVLGLGCDTMATMVTRTLPTKRERLISTFLLALAVPCSAQLGVLLGLFSGKFILFICWLVIIVVIFLAAGTILSKILPGEKPVFFMELPPIRFPKISSILLKTYTRMEWYFKEIFPLFIFASIFIWIGNVTGLFNFFIKIFMYPVKLAGLPPETAEAFLFGFFRRDFGAAGLYDIQKTGLLNNNQLLISAVILTLFVPCIAQLLMNIKERGWKTGISISAFVFIFAIIIGILLNQIFVLTGIKL